MLCPTFTQLLVSDFRWSASNAINLILIPDADPNNYMSYFKRATVFQALSRSRSALADLDKVLQLKSDFVTARIQRASVLFKMGRFDEAHIDVEKVLRKDPENAEANRIYTMIDPIKDKIRDAQDHIRMHMYEAAVENLSEIFEQVQVLDGSRCWALFLLYMVTFQVPWDPSLRDLRAEAYMGMDNLIHAISDIKSSVKLK